MATYYLPNESGWSDNGILGSAVKLRLKLEQSYSMADNRSMLLITPQFYSQSYGGQFILLDNALFTLNGDTLLEGGGHGTDSLGYFVEMLANDRWQDLRYSIDGQTASWAASIDHAANGQATASFGVKMKLYRDRNAYMSFINLSASQTLNETRQFTLTISAGANCTVSVLRNGSALANGAAITYGERLTVRFSADEGYRLSTHTVNGVNFTDGAQHTVTGDMRAAATAVRKTYTLGIDEGPGTAITVQRGNVSLANGASITHGETLKVRFAAAVGYRLLTHTVNGASFPDGGTLTVSGNLNAAASAQRVGMVRLDTGSELVRCRLLLDTGSALVPARIFLDRGDRISEAGI